MGIDWMDRGSDHRPPSPGPWGWADAGIECAALVAGPGRDVVLRLDPGDMSMADAALIASAPELRDALTWALVQLDEIIADAGRSTTPSYERARALLSRLDGSGR